MGHRAPTTARKKTPREFTAAVRPEAKSAARTAWLSLLLAAITLAVFAPVRSFGFVSWDDPAYVYQNPVVSRGLTPDGLIWALTSPGHFYWHPLTWLSHMTDVQLFAMQAGAHHLTNLVLHLAATLLLFWVLRAATGCEMRSALVAAVFAVHPLHVESVAWVAERKDVLGAVFWMLTLGAYVGYVRKPSRIRYAAVVASYALGLMSKPTLVTLPLILLLLDVWPLGRLDEPRGGGAKPSRLRRSVLLVIEKVPLFALSIAASIVTFFAQLHVGAVESLDVVPLPERAANAIVSAVSYIGMGFWPARLACFYPFRPVAGWKVWLCLSIVVAVSSVAFREWKRRPYLGVGWLWYLVTLLPVIGLVQVGSQSMADRFTYLPFVGLTVAIVWGVADLRAAVKAPALAGVACALAIVAAFAVTARAQVWYWHDSETLWRRAVDVVRNNDFAHANLGLVLAQSGRTDEAREHFSEALRIVNTPDIETGTGRGAAPAEYVGLLHHQLGLMAGRQGKWDEAIVHFREVERVQPAFGEGRDALGQALAVQGRLDEALAEAREAIRLEPGRAEYHAHYASILYRTGGRDAAISELQEALRLNPAHPAAATWHYNLAAMLNEGGKPAEAIRQLESALSIDPNHAQARAALTSLRAQAAREPIE